MAYATISVSVYPDVPVMAGVPTVLRDGSAAGVSALADDTSGYDVRWTVYDSSYADMLSMATMVAFAPSVEYTISSAPMASGGFTSYNKVMEPPTLRVSMTCDGSLGTVESFISALDALCASLDTYSVVTTDRTYINMNAVRYDYERTASRGLTMLTATLLLENVRFTATESQTSTATASGATATNTGQVQASSPTTSQSSSLDESDLA